MTKQLKVRLIPKDWRLASNTIIEAPFRAYRAGKVSRVWEMDRTVYKAFMSLGYIGYEVV